MFVYILQSTKTKSYYIGITKNLENRLSKHNRGEVLSTKSKRPWVVMHQEWYEKNSDAYKRERYLKSLKKRRALENLFMPSSSSLVRTLGSQPSNSGSNPDDGTTF